jgi:hypothetical protein
MAFGVQRSAGVAGEASRLARPPPKVRVRRSPVPNCCGVGRLGAEVLLQNRATPTHLAAYAAERRTPNAER